MTMKTDRSGWRYPTQLVILVPAPVGALIDDLAAREDLKKSEVLRSLLYAGIRKAGYGDVLATDKREKPVSDLAPKA